MISDSRERFSSRVDDYVRFRPGYPAALLQALLAGTAGNAEFAVADIGSGSGIFTRLLLERGIEVYAVDPNAAMRRAAETALGGFDNFSSVDGSAEDTDLGDAAVDLVTAAQAFHWFDKDRALAEFRRILKPAGRLALIWNRRDLQQPFQQAYDTLLREHAPEYGRVNHMSLSADEIGCCFAPGQMHRRRFDNRQRLDFDGLVRRLRSASYCPDPASAEYIDLLDALRRLFARYADDGLLEFTYERLLYHGPPAR